MPEPLHVAFTMDCERIAAESPPGGPETWELGERATRGYCDRLLDAGFAPTLFCAPECAARHRDMLLDYERRGVELGLHTHPQSFRGGEYGKYLAECDRETQKRIISEGLEDITEAFGKRPTSFRSGNLSASDGTFGVLVELGFRQGSNSIPERNAPQFAAVWEGACRDAHWANDADRLKSGSLPFFELPITTDPARLTPEGGPFEVRIEHGSFKELHSRTLESAVKDMDEREIAFPALCILTHNFFDYSDASDPRTQALEGIIGHFAAMSDREVVPVTLEEARKRYALVTSS